MRQKKGTQAVRFKKGLKVEVFCTTTTIPGGFWRPAQIVCGNGRTYSVQYDHVPSSPQSSTNVERVTRTVIRPCPPVKDKPIKRLPDDVVEVLVKGAWKVAKVIGVAYGNNFYFVVPTGHAREIAVKACNLRRRQMWKNNKWLLIKNSAKEHKGVYKHSKGVLNQNGSTVSSTGSCSTEGRPYQCPAFTHCDDDAKSRISKTKQTATSENEEVDQKIKRAANKLELEEYNSILIALHANGSITWEQEALLSALRISLNISTDEHRSILRSLAPAK